jgi:ABC-type lipoprotein export system ATPase subunit
MNHAILNALDGSPWMSSEPGPHAEFRQAAQSRVVAVADTLIEVRDVERLFDQGAVAALRGVSFSVARGEFVSVMGPSGSGKSSLLHLIGALDAPTAGEIRYLGQDLRSIRDLASFRARTIGFVFQAFHLLPTLTAIENVQVPMLEMPWPRRERRDRAARLLDSVGLANRLGHLPSTLSGGERQRVAIARSLANDPVLLLADEPTGNLDSESAGVIIDLLGAIHRERRMTVIVVTHDASVAAAAGRTLQMRDGRIVIDRSVAAAP